MLLIMILTHSDHTYAVSNIAQQIVCIEEAAVSMRQVMQRAGGGQGSIKVG
jgi:hypothetical protein